MNSAVMLSGAKHLWPVFFGARSEVDLRLKAWPRGLRPLRCSFSRDRGIRMTLQHGFVEPVL
jgi:hypothetical protein